MRKYRVALSIVICATAITAASLLGSAEASKKPKSLVGSYRGTTQEGGTVTFRLTASAKIVNFTLTGAKLYCMAKSSSKIPTFEPDFTKPLAKISHKGQIPMRGVSKKYPQGKEFAVGAPGNENVARQAGKFSGKVTSLTSTSTGGTVLPGKGFRGEVEFETANGPTPFPSSQNPTPVWPAGTEWCVTEAIDWTAKKPSDRGFVFG